MTTIDNIYIDLLNDVLENGSLKNTRSGIVYSVFDRNIKINMKDGFPLLTTKKIFYRGSFHEILWMIKGNTNIKYLLENNVHIWDDDAYRWYCHLISEHNRIVNDNDKKKICDKKEFLENCLKLYSLDLMCEYEPNKYRFSSYRYGDLGPVYGKQWRNFGVKSVDQIANIIEKLKNNPDDRRLLCSAWNPNDIDEMALPPCHFAFQFYTRLLSVKERIELYNEKHDEKIDVDSFDDTNENNVAIITTKLNDANIPIRELSLKWYQRSCDLFLGVPLNISGYALLLALVGQCVNMSLGTLSGSLGDCHIYQAHLNAVKEQIKRDPNLYKLPTLELNPNIRNINDFTIDDIKIVNYESHPKLTAPLCVG